MAGLIVFVDSLRFDAPFRQQMEGLGISGARHVPPLGYSANILPLLYRGRTPDELGFFNEFGPGEGPGKRLFPALELPARVLGAAPLGRKVVYRTVRALGVDAANIPFRYIPLFRHHATSAYAPNSQHPTIFEDLGFRVVPATKVRRRAPQRDPLILEEAMRAVDQHERVFVAMADLDSVSHEAGVGSSGYNRHLQLLERGVRELINRFRRRHGDAAPVVILSDHGMAPVTGTVRPAIERRLGRATPGRYRFFVDSTMLRIWIEDPALAPGVDEYFAELGDFGRPISEAERAKWGICDRTAGDRLFVLREGLVFEPNFIGRGVPLAMHGYHPEHESQHGVFLTTRSDLLPSASLSGRDAYTALKATFAERAR